MNTIDPKKHDYGKARMDLLPFDSIEAVAKILTFGATKYGENSWQTIENAAQRYAKPGWKIFDSHMGSQSSRIACYEMGFDFVGCELDKDYFDAGCKRFEKHISQLRMV